MLEVSTVSLVAILIAIWGCRQGVRYPLLFPCLILCAFLSTRYNYTCDYRSYSSIYAHLTATDDWDHSPSTRYLEIGWKILNWLCHPFGFQAVIVVETFFQLGTVCWFINRFVPRKSQWLVFTIYVIDPNMMLIGLSMMRQTMSVGMMLLATPYIFKKKIFKALIFWGLALSFHIASWIALPLVFAGYLNPKRWKLTAISEVTIVALAFAGQAGILFYFSRIGLMLPTSRLDYYMMTDKGLSLSSGLGFLSRIIFLSYLLYNMKHLRHKPERFAFSAIEFFNVVFIIIQLAAAFLSRLGHYYAIMGLPAFVVYAEKWRSSVYVKVILVLYIILLLYNLYTFYHFTFPQAYLEYRSIF